MRKDRTGFDTLGRDYSLPSVERMCFSKRTFATKNQARDAGLKYEQNPYRCPVCHSFHLTSLSNADGNKARRKAKL